MINVQCTLKTALRASSNLVVLGCLLSTVSVYGVSFKLFGNNWSADAVNITEHGWQHVYFCLGCRLTPTLSVTTSDEAMEDPPLKEEFQKGYKTVIQETGLIRGHQHFNVIRASSPLLTESPKQVTFLMTRYPSFDRDRWHYVQAFIEASSSEESLIAETRWLNLLAHVEVTQTSIILFPQDQASQAQIVEIDISRPDRNRISDAVERILGSKILAGGAALSTTAIAIFGVRFALGRMGVRGPCGGTIDQCQCTDAAITFLGIPVPRLQW